MKFVLQSLYCIEIKTGVITWLQTKLSITECFLRGLIQVHAFELKSQPWNTHKLEDRILFGSQERKTNFGLLFIRLGLAAMLLLYSLPKLFAGAGAWKDIGTTLGFINIGVGPTILGLIVLLLEGAGSISLIFGYFFRIACTVLFVLFGLYFFNYFSIGYKTLMLWSFGIATVFLGLIYIGPGRFAIAVKLEKK